MLPPSDSARPYGLPPYQEDSPPNTAPLPLRTCFSTSLCCPGSLKQNPSWIAHHLPHSSLTGWDWDRPWPSTDWHPTGQTGSSALLKSTPSSLLPQNVCLCWPSHLWCLLLPSQYVETPLGPQAFIRCISLRTSLMKQAADLYMLPPLHLQGPGLHIPCGTYVIWVFASRA